MTPSFVGFPAGYLKHIMERGTKLFGFVFASVQPRSWISLTSNGARRRASSYYTPGGGSSRSNDGRKNGETAAGAGAGAGPGRREHDGHAGKGVGSDGLTRMNATQQRMGVSPFFLPMTDAATNLVEPIVAKPSMLVVLQRDCNTVKPPI